MFFQVKKALGISEEVTINDDLIHSLMSDCEKDLERAGVLIPKEKEEKNFLLSAYVSYCNIFLNLDVNKQKIFKEIFEARKIELKIHKGKNNV